MKKSQFITLALVTSLSLFGCHKKDKDKQQPDEWSVQTDTENQGVVENYQGGSHVNPFFWYWMASRGGYGYHYYYGDDYRTYATSPHVFGAHSFTGGRSVISHSTGIMRGGFGSTGHGFGVSE